MHRRRRGRPAGGPGLDRLAVAQVLSGTADALVAVSLAGSLFFSLSPEASRQQVLLYLLINLVPYMVLAPLVGPAIDRLRHGPRNIAVFLFALRGLFAAGLAATLFHLGFYFFALALLVAAKATGVTRQALVPGLVSDSSELVAANSRLARLSVIAGVGGGVLGAGLLAVTTPAIAAGVASVLFLGSAAGMLRVPDRLVQRTSVSASVAYEEVHRPTVVSTAWAFTLVRAAVGFFVFGLVFALRRASEPAWTYGAAMVAYGAGSFGGTMLAPVLRRRYGEDRLTAGALVVLAVVAAFGALGSSRLLVFLVAVVLGGAASVARQSFDALVQTRAPSAVRGRTFARFETRFQVAWVMGAIAATAIAVPIQVSVSVVAVGLIPAAVLYVRSLNEAHRASVDDPYDPIELGRRRLDHAAEWHQRELDRFAAIELSSVVDLARVSNIPIATQSIHRIDELRAKARSARPIDSREIQWALACAEELLERMERRAQVRALTEPAGRSGGHAGVANVDEAELEASRWAVGGTRVSKRSRAVDRTGSDEYVLPDEVGRATCDTSAVRRYDLAAQQDRVPAARGTVEIVSI